MKSRGKKGKSATPRAKAKKTTGPKAKKKRPATAKKAAEAKRLAEWQAATIAKAKQASAKRSAAAKSSVASAGQPIHFPPLPPLAWDKHCWRGVDVLPAWAGLRFYSKWMKRNPKPTDGTVDIALETEGDAAGKPSASQLATYDFLRKSERPLAAAVLARILAEYPEAKRAYQEAVDETWPALPEISTVAELGAVIGPPTIHIHSNTKEPGALGTIGFAFDCAWDEEHQLSVLTHGTEILEIGDGSVAGHIKE